MVHQCDYVRAEVTTMIAVTCVIRVVMDIANYSDLYWPLFVVRENVRHPGHQGPDQGDAY